MKLLITGANGFTGQHLCQSLCLQGFEVHGAARGDQRFPKQEGIHYHRIELTDVRKIDALFDEIQPDVVIHTAAMSKPDECALHPAQAYLQNVTVSALLATKAAQSGAQMIHFSTDFIFGEQGPHAETDTPAPLNYYGETKLLAEEAVRTTLPNHIILRPVFIYGKLLPGMRPGFIQWVQQQLLQEKPIKVVTDQFRTPTYIGDIHDAIVQMIERNSTGIYHIAGPDIITPYEMAIMVAEKLQLNTDLIEPVTASTFPEPVTRAKRSGLLIDKARKALAYQPRSFRAALDLCFDN